MPKFPPTTIPCPWAVGETQHDARPCGEASVGLLVDVSTGEVDVACPEHMDVLEGFVEEFGTEHFVLTRTTGRLHNTSIAFSL
jgi:hypothetical protein